MSEDWLHTCSWCSETLDVTDAGGDPSKVAELLLAHLKLSCPAAPGPLELARLAEAEASAELALPPGEDGGFFAHWDLVSMGGVVLRTHHERQCRPPCAIHSPSEHHMRIWEQAWSQQLLAVFRRCPHGHFHPDPDDLQARTGGLLHTCDGCCLAPAADRSDR